MPNITIMRNGYFVEIKFDNLLHLAFRPEILQGLHSWIESPRVVGAKERFFLELHFGQSVIRCEYDEQAKWEKVLSLLGGAGAGELK